MPIILRDENIGTVLTFQNVQNIQEMEGKIRKKIFNRGHVAKHNFEDIIGNSRKINDVKYIAKRFSKVDSNILIEGETGTGKELFAQSIHNYSSRSSGPFVAVNCAALPESLLESELFGYAEGAFTGAARGGKLGLFELAHKGTIFLDEISEISPKLQGRLLRVIQEKEIMRLGHDRIIPVDIRVISATNKDLHTMVKLGEFREDLYYRLDILKVKLPPLRERKEDIIEILEHFLHTYSLQNKMGKITLSNKARDILTCYGWPGNIRELKNVCERLVVLNLGHEVSENDVRLVLPNRNDSEGISRFGEEKDIGLKYAEQVKELEREKIKEVLEEVGHNKVKAAEVLCVSRTTLWRRMKELGITS